MKPDRRDRSHDWLEGSFGPKSARTATLIDRGHPYARVTSSHSRMARGAGGWMRSDDREMSIILDRSLAHREVCRPARATHALTATAPPAKHAAAWCSSGAMRCCSHIRVHTRPGRGFGPHALQGIGTGERIIRRRAAAHVAKNRSPAGRIPLDYRSTPVRAGGKPLTELPQTLGKEA